MRTWVHAVASLILAGIFYPVFGLKALLILIGGILIDIDHYFWYAYKYKKLSLLDCYNHFSEQIKRNDFSENYGILIIFHTVEFFLIAIALSFYSKLMLVFLIGLLSHYVLDLIFLYTVPKRLIVNHSIVSWVIKNISRKIKS